MPPLAELRAAVAPRHSELAELVRRYGSERVRGAATIGSDIVHGSPIDDGPPAPIALCATLHLKRGDERRPLPIEDFFLDLGRQERRFGAGLDRVRINATDVAEAPSTSSTAASSETDLNGMAGKACDTIRVGPRRFSPSVLMPLPSA